jgi:hypothetical protein
LQRTPAGTRITAAATHVPAYARLRSFPSRYRVCCFTGLSLQDHMEANASAGTAAPNSTVTVSK